MWARKATAFVGLGFGVALCVWGLAYTTSRPDYKTLVVGKHSYKLAVVSSVSAQQKGLGGKASLPHNEGMLFTYAQPERRCFWMKDMRFSIDIVWLDSKSRVVDMALKVSPKTYPKTFCSVVPAQNVIELNAGEAARAGIHKGQHLGL